MRIYFMDSIHFLIEIRTLTIPFTISSQEKENAFYHVAKGKHQS